MNRSVHKPVYTALCLALAMVLPMLTGQIQSIGNMLCPMHIPVLLCGFLCGPVWGLAAGAVAPLLRFAIFGMPVIYPTGIAMAFELAAYGAVSGALYRVLPRSPVGLYGALAAAMVSGRVVWGCVQVVLAGLSGTAFPFSAFLAGAVTNAIPGIVLQLVLLPAIVTAMKRAGLVPGGE